MTLTDLAAAKPGETVGHIRHGGGQLIDIDVTRGTVPEGSDLAAPDADVYVTTDSMGNPQVVVGLENIHDGQASIGIETATGKKFIDDSGFVQKLLIEAMKQSGVEYATLNPRVAAVPSEALPAVGFHPDATGDGYAFSLT